MVNVYSGTVPRAASFDIAHARYSSTDTTSTVATGSTELILTWNVVETADADITASGTNNTTFTLNRTGIWIVEFASRVGFSVNPTTGDFYCYAYLVDGVMQFAGMDIQAPTYINSIPWAATVREFNAGDQIQLRMRNSTDKILSMACQTSLCHVSFTLLQGL